jgi:hypothetical protein
MNRPSKLAPAISAAAVAAWAIALTTTPVAVAGAPEPDVLNPPPPDMYTCRSVGNVTLCTAEEHEVKVAEPQPELVCGSGPNAFVIHDNAVLDARFTRYYDTAGNLTRRVIQERWSSAFWSNPLSGKTVPYTQTDKITALLRVPGDFDSAVETTVGENIYTDPVTHRKVLNSTGRVSFGADGTLEFAAGQQPFIEAFFYGDMSVFDALCAALA